MANPHEQRGLPIVIRALHELGDRAGIRRLYTTTTTYVDELEDDTADAFDAVLARRA